MSLINKIRGGKSQLKFQKSKYEKTLRKATLCFLIKDDQILLAEKKRGFAVGKINGVGGKVNDVETEEEAIVRETEEEIGVVVTSLDRVAELSFYFLNNTDYNQKVYVYVSRNWKGVPAESEEMRPSWYPIKKIPFDKMWSDDILWLPSVLRGKKLKASFLFDENEGVIDKLVEYVSDFK